MTSSNRSIHICIICGNQKKYTELSNAQPDMDEIHQHVRNLFGTLLPASYCIKTYNIETKEFINLNQNELDYGYNPFRLYPSIDDQDIQSILDFVDLYVASDSPVNFEINTQSSSPCQETILLNDNYSSSSIAKGQECQHASSLTSSATDSNILHENDLSSALLNSERGDHINWLLNNDATNDHPSEEASVENILPAQNNLSILIQNSNICRDLAELNEAQNTQLNRLDFSLDVKPTQKDIYKSDRFNQKDKNKTNGYIARIQGIKTGKPAKSSVLPKIRIPPQYRNKPNLWLDTYAVSEQLRYGKRIWIKHRDKGFLPKCYTHSTSPVNPISFALNINDLTKEGDFKLALPMMTMWNKSESLEEEVYQLDERAAIDLHHAAYEPSSPRLFCVLRQNNAAIWETACLSDYIRPTKARKRALTSTNTTTQNNEINCKKARIE